MTRWSPARAIALGIVSLAGAACATSRVAPASALAPAEVTLYARVLAAADARGPDSVAVAAAIGSG